MSHSNGVTHYFALATRPSMRGATESQRTATHRAVTAPVKDVHGVVRAQNQNRRNLNYSEGKQSQPAAPQARNFNCAENRNRTEIVLQIVGTAGIPNRGIPQGPKIKKNKLVVRFPQCNDVAWVHAPKFEKNQEGIFFLTKDEVSGAPTALLDGTEVNAYTCLRPGDWLPKSDQARVRSLLKKMRK